MEKLVREIRNKEDIFEGRCSNWDKSITIESEEFGVYCIYYGYVRWGKRSDEVRKCPNCDNTKKSLMMNVNRGEIENIKKLRIRV